ncbi:MAG: hypothetical protein U0401_11465, partial [Anaerolineae bacterium]
ISVPTLIVGKGSRISTLGIDRVVVPLETELGTLRVNLALRASEPEKMPPTNGTTPALKGQVGR